MKVENYGLYKLSKEHHDERRKLRRIHLKIHARGSFTAKDGVTEFVAFTVELTTAGIQLELTDHYHKSFRQILSDGNSLETSKVDFKLISYFEKNIRLKGNVAYIKRDTGKTRVGIELEDLEEDAKRTIEKIMEKRQDIVPPIDERYEDYRFETLENFMDNLSLFIIDSEKQETFWISGQSYIFGGMHISEQNEVHTDCIVKTNDADSIFCPDCRLYLSGHELI